MAMQPLRSSLTRIAGMLPPLIRRVFRRIYVRRTPLAPLAIALVFVMSWAGSAAAHPVSHADPQPREKVVRYWTPERMSQATPAERDARPRASAKPAKGGGGGTSTGTSTE